MMIIGTASPFVTIAIMMIVGMYMTIQIRQASLIRKQRAAAAIASQTRVDYSDENKPATYLWMYGDPSERHVTDYQYLEANGMKRLRLQQANSYNQLLAAHDVSLFRQFMDVSSLTNPTMEALANCVIHDNVFDGRTKPTTVAEILDLNSRCFYCNEKHDSRLVCPEYANRTATSVLIAVERQWPERMRAATTPQLIEPVTVQPVRPAKDPIPRILAVASLAWGAAMFVISIYYN